MKPSNRFPLSESRLLLWSSRTLLRDSLEIYGVLEQSPLIRDSTPFLEPSNKIHALYTLVTFDYTSWLIILCSTFEDSIDIPKFRVWLWYHVKNHASPQWYDIVILIISLLVFITLLWASLKCLIPMEMYSSLFINPWSFSNLRLSRNQPSVFNCREELEAIGKIVTWCSQLEVLSSPATGCFVTHCGWNSTLESLVCGVPMVGFPQWADQGTNAKIIEDMSETGVRVEVGMDGMVKREEIKRCLEVVMGDSNKGEEIRKKALKWKELAKEAARNGGSSHANFKAFVDQLCS